MADIDFGALDAGVTPQQLNDLKTSQAFLQGLLADPEARPIVIARYKKMHPDVYIPEHDVAEQVRQEAEAKIKPVSDELASLRKEREDERAARFWDGVKSKVSASGLAEGSFEDVQKLMTEKGIADPDVAIAYLKSQETPNAESFDWRTSLPDAKDDDNKGLIEDPRGWARQKAHESIDQLLKTA